jgi:hypothetical protein
VSVTWTNRRPAGRPRASPQFVGEVAVEVDPEALADRPLVDREVAHQLADDVLPDAVVVVEQVAALDRQPAGVERLAVGDSFFSFGEAPRPRRSDPKAIIVEVGLTV